MPKSSRQKSDLHPRRAKLIFNTIAGRADESPAQLTEILIQMQANHIMPEVFIVQPDSDVGDVVRRAIADETKLIVVSGGDGTVEAVAHEMVGTDVTLGIVPTGTRNNLALNLGIPLSIPDAVGLLSGGTPLRIDMGRAASGGKTRYFMELVSMGLMADLYPIADDLQHGDITRIGPLLGAFVAASPSQAQLTLDRARKVGASGHVVLVANMPFIGPNVQIDPQVSFRDGMLDVFVFSDKSKLLLLVNFALRTLAGNIDQESVAHFKVKQLRMSSEPAMTVFADNAELGSGTARVDIVPEALTVMVGSTRGRGPTKEDIAKRKQANA
jgi:diacylglycerol kinase family enzyme